MMREPPISFGFVDGRPLFLDLDEDCYFQLEPAAEAAFLRWLSSGALSVAAPNELQAAFAPERLASEPVCCPRPLRSALAGEAGRCSLGDVGAAWKLVLEARLAIRSKRLAHVLADLRRNRRNDRPRPAGETVENFAASFAKARRLAPVAGNCLSNSLALLRWLAARGEGATLVFGAKLDPFAAHCWVQSEDLLLNDHPDRVERFTPLRLIECTPASP